MAPGSKSANQSSPNLNEAKDDTPLAEIDQEILKKMQPDDFKVIKQLLSDIIDQIDDSGYDDTLHLRVCFDQSVAACYINVFTFTTCIVHQTFETSYCQLSGSDHSCPQCVTFVHSRLDLVTSKWELSNTAKLSVFKSVQIFTYGHESWAVTERILSQAAEMSFCWEFTAWYFATKCAAVKFAEPWM